MGKPALFIVDVQVDFCPGGALPVPDGDKVVPVINDLMNYFDVILASKDWHPPKTKHFEKWPPHCVAGTPGADFHPELNAMKIQKVFYKGTSENDDGYSAFEATNDDLEDFLKRNGIDHLYITGLATDYCVRATALDALKRGFKVSVVKEAVRGVKLEDSERALKEIQENGGEVISVNEVKKRLSREHT